MRLEWWRRQSLKGFWNTSRRGVFGTCVSVVFMGSTSLLGPGVPRATAGELKCYPRDTNEQLPKTLTFVERTTYQHAIEEVYWGHRIWPKENPVPKPRLDTIVSKAQIENKVEEYLRKSQLLAEGRGWPITASELQAEMERMANHTREPQVLRELFQAVGNDPFVIAECLVRPILAERLVRECEDGQTHNHEAIADSPPSPPGNIVRGEADPPGAAYKLPEISSVECADSWAPTTTMNAPTAREAHSAVWTGSEMIVWGGSDQSNTQLNTGGRYDPATDNWTAMNIANAPDPRWFHSTVWSGSEMIIWGGFGDNIRLNSGGRYNPITDTWTAISAVNAPIARNYHSGVWTGSEMIIWGGSICSGCISNTGGRYNPSNDSWEPTSTVNAPTARESHSAVGTGSEMIVWGGSDFMHYLNTGGKYDPNTDSWTATGLTNVPLGRISHEVVWTGNEMIVWGGVVETSTVTNTGGRYNPLNDTWVATSLANVPPARSGSKGVWTGTEMIVWGGGDTGGDLNTGGRYDAGTDSWTATTTVNAPLARDSHNAVWTGSEMIVWGGSATSGLILNTGAIYCAQPSATSTPTPGPTATATPTSTPTPTTTPTPTPTTSASPTSTPIPGTRAINLSTRLRVGTGNDVGIGGFIVSGTGPRHILLRGLGPSLGIPSELPDPMLCLQGSGIQTLCNDNWMDDPAQKALIQATGIPPTHNLESAIVADLNPGAYTAILSGNGGVVGIGLVEIYDLTMNQDSKLANISTRADVGTGNDIVIAGFILGDGTDQDLLVLRGIGPSLTSVPSPLADPYLELRNAQGALLASNNNWTSLPPDQKALLMATGLAPSDNLESTIVATLNSAPYTVLLSGINGGTGIGLVEVYDRLSTPTPTPGLTTPTPTPTAGGTPTPTPGGGTPTATPGVTPSPAPGTCTENFDSVTAPALPLGWVASNPIPGDGVMWGTTTTMPDTPPNAAFIPDQSGISDKALDRVNVTVQSASAAMTFRNSFNTETSETFWDGGVLEVSVPSISNGDFLDVTDFHIGGTITAGGYTGEIGSGNPLAGRMAWNGNSGGYINTVINLGPNMVGQTVTFRWRFGTGGTVPAPGWWIDNLSITDAICP